MSQVLVTHRRSETQHLVHFGDSGVKGFDLHKSERGGLSIQAYTSQQLYETPKSAQ